MLQKLVLILGLVSGLVTLAISHIPTADAGELININTASVEELASLPGIGEKKAQAIVDHRNLKPFQSKEELQEVKGVGEKLLAKIAPLVTVAGEIQTAQTN